MKREILVRLPKLNDCNGDLEKKWFVFYSVRNPKTGKMERFRHFDGLHRIKTKRERYAKAEERIAFYADRLQNGWTPFDHDENVIYNDQLEYQHVARLYGTRRTSNKTARFFASKFLETLSGLEDTTVKTYKSKLRIFCDWLQVKGYAQNDVGTITNEVIIEFFRYVIDDQKRSRTTVLKYNQMLTSLFDYMIQQKAIKLNPVFNIPKTTYSPDLAARPIQEMDIETFLTTIDTQDPQLGLAIRFEFNCFLRPKEIRFMQVKWIDFGAGTIVVPRQILKTKHDRIAQIPRNFLLKLREMKLHLVNKEFYVIGKDYQPAKQHLGKNNLRFRFNKIRKKLNMPIEYKFYSWKHSGNVRAEQHDMPMVDRMHQNGHTSYKTTETYTRNKIGRVATSFKNFEGI